MYVDVTATRHELHGKEFSGEESGEKQKEIEETFLVVVFGIIRAMALFA